MRPTQSRTSARFAHALLELKEFRGLNATLDPTRLPAGAAAVLRNADLRDGTLRKSAGASVWGTCEGSSRPCRGVWAHQRPGGTVTVLAYAGDGTGGRLYRKANPSGAAPFTLSALSGVLAADVNPEAAQLHRCTYLCDGGNLWIYDGEADTLAAYAPLTAPAADDAAYRPVVKPYLQRVVSQPMGVWTTCPEDWYGRLDGEEIELQTTADHDHRMAAVYTRASNAFLGAGDSVITVAISEPAAPSIDVEEFELYYPIEETVFGVTSLDLTSSDYGTDRVYFLLTFRQADWERLHDESEARIGVFVSLWNGVPGDEGVLKVSVPVENVNPGKVHLCSLSRKEVERQAEALGMADGREFWKAVAAFGITVRISFPTKASTGLSFDLGGVYLPGRLADTSQLEVGYTYYNSTTRTESGLSPTATVDLTGQDETWLKGYFDDNQPGSYFGVVGVTLHESADSPAPDKVRIYLRRGGVWRYQEVAATGFDPTTHLKTGSLNTAWEDLTQGNPPRGGSGAAFTPYHVAALGAQSRLVVLGCTYEGEAYPNRVWISDFVDPLVGLGLRFPEAPNTNVPVDDSIDPLGNDGMPFDLPDAGGLLAGKQFGGMFYLFAARGLWRLTGYDSTNFAVGQVTAAVGCAARGSVCETEAGLVYLGTDNQVHLFNGEAVVPLGGSPSPVKGLLDGTGRHYLDEAQATYGDGRYLLSFGSAGESRGICFDFLTGAWSEVTDGAVSRGVYAAPRPAADDLQNCAQVLAGDLEATTGRVLRLSDPGTFARAGDNRTLLCRSGVVPVSDDTGEAELRNLYLAVWSADGGVLAVSLWDQDQDPDLDTPFHEARVVPEAGRRVSLRLPLTLHWLQGVVVQVEQQGPGAVSVGPLSLLPYAWRERVRA